MVLNWRERLVAPTGSVPSGNVKSFASTEKLLGALGLTCPSELSTKKFPVPAPEGSPTAVPLTRNWSPVMPQSPS